MIFKGSIGGDTFEIDTATTTDAEHLFDVWNDARQPQSVKPTLRFTTFAIDKDGNYMLLLTVTQKCSLFLDPRDAKGNPAALDGVPDWSSSDPSVVEVLPAVDGLSAVARAVGPVGSAQVNVTADARIGPDVVAISGTLDVTVQAGEAVTLGIGTGTPEEQ